MTIATELARRIRAFTYDGLPDAALEWAKTGILDTVGVTLAGSAEPCAQIMLRVYTATGPALVFGSAQRLSVTDAALVNGTASHALDFDDCSNTLGGHPSVPILPGLFALADAMPVAGAISWPPMWRASRPKRASPAPSTSTITTRAGTRPQRWAYSAPPQRPRGSSS